MPSNNSENLEQRVKKLAYAVRELRGLVFLGLLGILLFYTSAGRSWLGVLFCFALAGVAALIVRAFLTIADWQKKPEAARKLPWEVK